MIDRREELLKLLNTKKFDQAIAMINTATDYHDAGESVSIVLYEENVPNNVINTALEVFLRKRENINPEHGYWVHSMSHFSEFLWKHRMIEWIKRFNEVAFRGANELKNDSCCDRLMYDFVKYSHWGDDPANFHISLDLMGWMDWTHYQYAKARIEAGTFNSEIDFLKWKLITSTHLRHDNDSQTALVHVDNIHKIIQQLRGLGADVSEFDNFEQDQLTKRLTELEAELSTATEDWQLEGLPKAITKTRTALNACNS